MNAYVLHNNDRGNMPGQMMVETDITQLQSSETASAIS